MKTVLIITSSYDSITDYITSIYSDKCFFFRMDVDRMCDYSFQLNKHGWSIDNYRDFVTDQTVNSIYYRKPSFSDFKKYDAREQGLLKMDIATIIKGIVCSFEGKCLTKPDALERSENKVYQLQLANKVGFDMPECLITNSRRCATIFSERGNAIVKTLSVNRSSLSSYVYSKKREMEKPIDLPQSLEISPAYFQHAEDTDYEVKSNFICGNFYTLKIESITPKIWRPDEEELVHSNAILPEAIKEKCRAFMNLIGLEFGTFHFIVKGDTYYFLELNPNGNWIRPENEFGWKLSSNIVDYLCS